MHVSLSCCYIFAVVKLSGFLLLLFCFVVVVFSGVVVGVLLYCYIVVGNVLFFHTTFTRRVIVNMLECVNMYSV